MELQVQSNLPVIILCILVISLCVLGYFEYKKMMIRFESIDKKLSELSEKKDDKSSPDLTLEEKQQMIMRQQQMQQQQMQQQMIMRQQQMQQNQMQQNNKINVDMDLPKEQNVEELKEDTINKEIKGLSDDKDEEIVDDNKSSNDDYSDDDSRSSDYSDSYSERSDDSKHNSDDYSDNSDDYSDNNGDNKDNDNDNDNDNNDDKENIEDIVDITDEFKDKYIGDNEIKLATEVSNDKKTVLTDMSVNQLKDECKVLNLPISGNKTKLIQRIETFKKIE